jgi:predicted dehydrogenase
MEQPDSSRPLPAPQAPQDSSRRAFLAGAAALAGVAVAGCQTTSVAALGQVPKAAPRIPLAPDAPIRMGLIGTGGMGNGHLDAFLSFAEKGLERVQIVALSDVCKPRLDAAIAKCAQAQHASVDGYRDYRELLAREDLHGVLIASPEHWHAQMALDAIAAGKDAYLEKPMTLRLEDAFRLRRAVQENDALLQVGTQYMMLPKYHEAKRMIAEGVIGKPTLAQTSYCRNSKDGEWLYEIDPRVQPGEMLDWERWCGPLGPQPFDTKIYHRWRRYRKYSTGIVGDLLVHMMTPMVNALDPGWPVRVSAVGDHVVDKEMENHDQVFLTIQFEKEQQMIVAGSTCNENGLETLIRGHKGNIHLGSEKCQVTPERVFVDELEERTVNCPQIADQDELRRDWLKCIRTREAVKSPVEFGTRIMVIVDLATRSMWEGSAFLFDPATFEVRRA